MLQHIIIMLQKTDRRQRGKHDKISYSELPTSYQGSEGELCNHTSRV